MSKGRKGNVIIETALVSLVFFLLLFGIFDFGQFLFVHQALVQRARAAVRAGAIYGDTDAVIVNRILYGQTTAKMDGEGNALTGYFGLTSANVTVSQAGAGTDSARINVTITNFPFVMLSPYMAGKKQGAAISMTVPLGQFN